jgi:hypothetical protein
MSWNNLSGAPVRDQVVEYELFAADAHRIGQIVTLSARGDKWNRRSLLAAGARGNHSVRTQFGHQVFV